MIGTSCIYIVNLPQLMFIFILSISLHACKFDAEYHTQDILGNLHHVPLIFSSLLHYIFHTDTYDILGANNYLFVYK